MADNNNNAIDNKLNDSLSDFEKAQNITDGLETIYSASDDSSISKLASQLFPQIHEAENTLLSAQEGAVINSLNSIKDINTATEQAKFSFDDGSTNSMLSQINFSNALNNSVNDTLLTGLQARETLRNNTSAYTTLIGDALQNEQTAEVAGEYIDNLGLSTKKSRELATDVTNTILQEDAKGTLDFLYDEQDIANGYLISEGWYNTLYDESSQNLWARLIPAIVVGISAAASVLIVMSTGGLAILAATAALAVGTGLTFSVASANKWVKDSRFKNNLQENFSTAFPSDAEWEEATQTVYNETTADSDFDVIDNTAYAKDTSLSADSMSSLSKDLEISEDIDTNAESLDEVKSSFNNNLTYSMGNVLDLSTSITQQRESTKEYLKRTLVTSLGNILGQKTLSSVDSVAVADAMKNVENDVNWTILQKQAEKTGYNNNFSKIAIKDNESQANINDTLASFIEQYPTKVNNTKEARFARINEKTARQTYNDVIKNVSIKTGNSNSSIF